MNGSPSIAVVITCCPEDWHLLPRCLDSVTWQLKPGDEMLVVCDGAGGKFPPIPNHPKDAPVCLQERMGVSGARNFGVRCLADQEFGWIKFLDVDDLLAPCALEAIRDAARKTSAQVIAGGQFVLHNGRFTGLRPAQPGRFGAIKLANPCLVSQAAIRREALKHVGGFDGRIAFEEDWDLWLKLDRAYGRAAFAVITDPVCFYTIEDAVRAEKEKTRSHTVRVLKRGCEAARAQAAGELTHEDIDVREHFRREYGCTPI